MIVKYFPREFVFVKPAMQQICFFFGKFWSNNRNFENAFIDIECHFCKESVFRLVITIKKINSKNDSLFSKF